MVFLTGISIYLLLLMTLFGLPGAMAEQLELPFQEGERL